MSKNRSRAMTPPERVLRMKVRTPKMRKCTRMVKISTTLTCLPSLE